jgi:LysW-gamma-L-lysine carboxypeptidase
VSDAALVDGVDTEARNLLERLVSTASSSGEETACAAELVTFLETHDRRVFIDEVGNVRAPADDSVLLTSHIDTVPGEIPVRVTTEDGTPTLWGRGSVDAKGPLTAMAVAAVHTGVSFVGVVGEEVDSRGARYLVEDRKAPDAVVNGEPSGVNGITLGYRGILSGTYVATSESGHTSRPENNAIQDAIAWWSAVETEFENDPYEPIFEQVTAKPVSLDGGTSDDGLSVEATMDVQLRIPPSKSAEQVREIADGHLDGGHVNWHDWVRPTMASPRNELARAFRVAVRDVGLTPRLLRKTGTADVNIYAGEWDCPTVTYGPGDSELDHAPDERLPLPDLDRATAVLKTAVGRLL